MIANGYPSKIPQNIAPGCSILLSLRVTGLASTAQVALGSHPNLLLTDNWAVALMGRTFQMSKTWNMCGIKSIG
jgi:hypothetical protein